MTIRIMNYLSSPSWPKAIGNGAWLRISAALPSAALSSYLI
jgi:hypothetical protein